MKISDKNADLIVKISLFGLAYLFFAKPVLNFLGISKGAGVKEIENAGSDEGSPLNPNYFLNKLYVPFINEYKKGMVIGTENLYNKIKKAAHEIYWAMGTFIDDEAAVKSAFDTMRTKAEVSALSAYFSVRYNKSLPLYLKYGANLMPQNGLNSDELLIITNYIRNLPVK